MLLNAPPSAATASFNSIPAEPMLGPEASAELRDRLIAELNDLAGGDDAAIWAHGPG